MSFGATSRWAVSIVAIVITLVAASVAIDRLRDPVSQRNRDRIKEGMTSEQVIAIMGRKPNETSVSRFLEKRETWEHRLGSATLVVWYDKERVEGADFYKDISPSVLFRFLRWIGFE